MLLTFVASCDERKEHIASAIRDRDSVSMMTSYGVNTLISDSGVIKYRIVAERWDVNIVKNPSRWTFDKGLFLEQFDEKFHVESYIQLRPVAIVGVALACAHSHQVGHSLHERTAVLGRA